MAHPTGDEGLKAANYGVSLDPAKCCGTCAFFDMGHCSMFDAEVASNGVCSEWSAVAKADGLALKTYVAIFLEASDANQIAVAPGERPEDMHMTLAFLGNLNPTERARAAAVVKRFAAETGPIRASLGLPERFPNCLYLPVSAPSLRDIHGRLVAELKAAGVPVDELTFPRWVPHVTLSYISPVESAPALNYELPREITLRNVSLCSSEADGRKDYPLTGMEIRKAKVRARKDGGAPVPAPSGGEGPSLNSVHVDAPPDDVSVAYVNPRRKRKRKVVARKAEVRLVKADSMQQIIYGVALEPGVVDSQGDVVRPEEIEKAAHGYLAKAVRGQNSVHKLQHVAQGFRRDRPSIVPVESYVAPCDFTLGGDTIRKGSWVLAAKVEDPQLWQDFLDGKYTGWSIGGSGLRTPIVAKNDSRADELFADGVDDAAEMREDDKAEADAQMEMLDVIKRLADRPEPAAPIVHVHFDKDAISHPITVNVPEQTAPNITVKAPIVHNHVEPTPIENHAHVNVEAPKRGPMRARQLPDGTRVYEPVDDAA